MGQKTFVPISVRGPLDTANPISDRAPGTLVDATDLATRWWGPRLGFKSLTHPHSRASGLPSPAPDLIEFTGAAGEALTGSMVDLAQRDLGSKWTVDVVISPGALSAPNPYPIFEFPEIAHPACTINIRGSTAAAGDQRKITATIGYGANDYELESTTQVGTQSSGPDKLVHVRVVRDGVTGYLYINGTLEDTVDVTTTAASNTGTASSGWAINGNSQYIGYVLRAVVRTGAFTDGSTGFSDFMFPRSRNVRLYVVPTYTTNGSTTVRDLSRWRSDGTTPTVITSEGSPTHAPPYRYPVNGLGTFTDNDGKTWNVVMIADRLYWDRVG